MHPLPAGYDMAVRASHRWWFISILLMVAALGLCIFIGSQPLHPALQMGGTIAVIALAAASAISINTSDTLKRKAARLPSGQLWGTFVVSTFVLLVLAVANTLLDNDLLMLVFLGGISFVLSLALEKSWPHALAPHRATISRNRRDYLQQQLTALCAPFATAETVEAACDPADLATLESMVRQARTIAQKAKAQPPQANALLAKLYTNAETQP